jgi:hypothetical protein
MIGSDENLSPGLRQKYKFGKLELDNGIPTLWASIYSETCLIQTLLGTRLCVQNRQVFDIYRVNYQRLLIL